MAKETIQEAYSNGVSKLEELEKFARRTPKNGQTRSDLANEIMELRKQLIYVKQYLLKNEELQAEADKQWQSVIIARERAASIEKNLMDYYDLKAKYGNNAPELEKLKQDIANNFAFIDPKYEGITEDKFNETSMEILLEAGKAAQRHSEIVEELNKLQKDTLENPIWVDETRPEADRERILSEKRSQVGAENQGTLEDVSVSDNSLEETLEDDSNFDKSPEESLEDIDNELKRVEEFKKLAQEKERRYTRIANLDRVRLNNSKCSKNVNKNIRSLQKEIATREKFIKNFVYDFSQNPNYEVSDELRALIGSKDGDNKNTVIQRPTVKQHLDPILKIEDELKNGVSPEREKELKAEKEKREKRLGKKWLIKLKIDKINNCIKELNQLLSGDLSPEDKKKYEAELLNLKGELIGLQKEYGEVLEQIAGHISDAVEKSANERKAEIKQKVKEEKAKTDVKLLQEDTKQQSKDDKKTSQTEQTKNADSVNIPRTGVGTVSSQGFGTNVSQGSSNTATTSATHTTETNSNLPMVKEETWLDKLKAKFAKKEQPTKTCIEPEVRVSVDINDDISAQQVSMREAGNYPAVEGKYFYHTIRDGDKLKYVKEPLTNIECTKKELVNKIREAQEKYGAYYKGLYEEQKKNPLFVNPNIIANKLVGFSNGIEKRQRILKAICSLEAAIHPSEAIDALNGKSTIIFRPAMNAKGEFVDLRSASYLDAGDTLAQYAGKIKYKENEINREKHQKVNEFFERLSDAFEASDRLTTLTENVENNNLEQVENNSNNNLEQTENNVVLIDEIKKQIVKYREEGIPDSVIFQKIKLDLMAKEAERRAETIESEAKANDIRMSLGGQAKEPSTDNVTTITGMTSTRRGRTSPKDYATPETKKRRAMQNKPTLNNIVTIPDKKQNKDVVEK